MRCAARPSCFSSLGPLNRSECYVVCYANVPTRTKVIQG
jgi:hypothetical protein